MCFLAVEKVRVECPGLEFSDALLQIAASRYVNRGYGMRRKGWTAGRRRYNTEDTSGPKGMQQWVHWFGLLGVAADLSSIDRSHCHT